jgi:calcineurin-like phosphoesterase family protein
MATYICSDPHFGHENVIKYEDRPFSSVEEMDKTLIVNWNNVVRDSKRDKVWCLGDIGFRYSKEMMTELLKKLNGRKYLIMGNHDRAHSVKWWKDVGFEFVSEWPIIYRSFYILSHEPVYLNKSMPFKNLHGHTHGIKMDYEGYVNVCVEHTGYKPVDIETLIIKEEVQEEDQPE